MSIDFNHTIVHATDKKKSATFLAEILGLGAPESLYNHFLVVRFQNGVSLDFVETSDRFDKQHYAFHVSEKEFDDIFERIKTRRLTYWADPGRVKKNETYKHINGRGVYFEDPSGHLYEILTWV
jgi:catechol 2,3-dioxygenase-like lactoylglutathione lyase family enzyme